MSLTGKIALVIGHAREGDQGAVSAAPLSESEFVYNDNIAARAKQYGESRGHEVEIFYRPRRGFSGIREAYEEVSDFEPECALELHFNAFNTKVRGTETLLASAGDSHPGHEIELARLVQDGMMDVFGRLGRRDRGLKERPRTTRERGWYNVNQTRLFPTLLLEPFFGDNTKEAELARDRRQEYAEMLILRFERWLEYVGRQHGLM